MKNKKLLVFTNGCFDIIHKGHIHLLRQAKSMGSKLIVGLNSDASVRLLKGASRPINNQHDRLLVLSSIRYVDEVIIFDQADPLELIMNLNPDVLVKGSDYSLHNTIGAKYVIENGGIVNFVKKLPDVSSSSIINEIRNGIR